MKHDHADTLKTGKRSMRKRILSVALACSMLAQSIPASFITAMAEEPLSMGSWDDGTDMLIDMGSQEDGFTQPDGALNLNGTDPGGLWLQDEESYWPEDHSGGVVFEDAGNDWQGDDTANAGQVIGETVATVSSAEGSKEYADFSSAWEAAAAAASSYGSAEVKLYADWISSTSGSFGSGPNFGNEGSILMDLNGAKITIHADHHKIMRQGGQTAGGCIFGIFDGSLVIRNAVITGADSSTDGGAFLVLGGSVVLDGVTVTGNRAAAGAGLCVTGGSVTLKNSTITDNVTGTLGGGVSMWIPIRQI